MNWLEVDGKFDRKVENLLDEQIMMECYVLGYLLICVEIGVLLLYVKIVLFDDLVVSNFFDDFWFVGFFLDYFFVGMCKVYVGDIVKYCLCCEIIVMVFVNYVINCGGLVFIMMLLDVMGVSLVDIVKVVIIVCDGFGLLVIWCEIDVLDIVIFGN